MISGVRVLYCACHACGMAVNLPCDTSEERARKIAGSQHLKRQRIQTSQRTE